MCCCFECNIVVVIIIDRPFLLLSQLTRPFYPLYFLTLSGENCDFYPCPTSNNDTPPTQELNDANANADPGNNNADSSTSQQQENEWGSIPLKYVGQCAAGECGLCEGDCNSNDDCQSGLLCFSRPSGDLSPVPGCASGGGDDRAGMDYCHLPTPPTTTTTTTTTTATTTTVTDQAAFLSAQLVDYTFVNLKYARECTDAAKCNACEGDCDNDNHCAEGLVCFSRSQGNMDKVPGCDGLGIAGELILGRVMIVSFCLLLVKCIILLLYQIHIS